jgi:hypothetical protein
MPLTERPQVVASFVFNDTDELEVEKSVSPLAYWISICVRNTPDDTYSVTYHLHPTYHDPVIEVRTPENNFRIDVTSYGDYAIGATVRTRSFTYTITRGLHEALMETHGQDPRPAVREALESIHRN